jgi:hypothetical protein
VLKLIIQAGLAHAHHQASVHAIMHFGIRVGTHSKFLTIKLNTDTEVYERIHNQKLQSLTTYAKKYITFIRPFYHKPFKIMWLVVPYQSTT